MHYYTHNIGDHLREANFLSMIEEGALLRLRDRYASSEKPLPKDLKTLNRLVRALTPDEQEAVKTVLHEFFEESEDGWRCPLIDEKIQFMNDISEKRRSAAVARWYSKAGVDNSEQVADGLQMHSTRSATQNPSTKTQNRRTTLPNKTLADQPSADLSRREQARLKKAMIEVWKVWPRKSSHQFGLAMKALHNALAIVGWEKFDLILERMRAYAEKAKNTEPMFIMLPHNWLNEHRWEDE